MRAPTIVETARLILREIDVDNGDAEAMYALNDDPEVVRFTGDGPFASVDAARAFVTAYRDVYAREGFARWAVVPKAGEPLAGVNVGFCGLRRQPGATPGEGEVDLGYRLARDLGTRLRDRGCAGHARVGVRDRAARAHHRAPTSTMSARTASSRSSA